MPQKQNLISLCIGCTSLGIGPGDGGDWGEEKGHCALCDASFAAFAVK